MARDYYDILGIQKQASADDIKKAFRKKAHELHPDKGGDAQAFKEVNEAFQVLGDEKKRAAYDRFGHSAFQGAGGPGYGGYGFGGFDGVNINMEDLGDLGDVIGSMFGFGGGARGSRTKKGRDIETSVDIDFLEAVHGVIKPVTLRVHQACHECKGTGANGGTTKTCQVCGGRGQVQHAQRTPFGVFQSLMSCAECGGAGRIPESPCTACAGKGVVVQNKTLQVHIPQGIADGETVRIQGEGEVAERGGKAGDLYVHVRVRAHPHFVREGNDVRSEERVPSSVFFLGGKVDIRTVDGQGTLSVPAGTQPGTVFTLRGHGMPYLHSRSRGDQLVTLLPDVPKKLSREQKKLLEDLRDAGL